MKKAVAVLAFVGCASMNAFALSTGDMVGFDIDYTKDGAPFGHVGVINTNTGNEPCVIEATPPDSRHKPVHCLPLSMVKSRGAYWGAKYSDWSRANWARIYYAAQPEMNNCSLYTYTTEIQIGAGVRCAVFRNDTFVNYLLYDINQSKPYSGISPQSLFSSYNKVAEPGIKTTTNLTENSSSLSLSNIETKEFSQLTLSEMDNLLSSSFVHDKNEEDSVKKWWEFAVLENDAIHQSYALDVVAFHGGEEYTTKMIELYSHVKTDEQKYNVFKALTILYQRLQNQG